RGAVFRAQLVGGKVRMIDQVRGAERLAEPLVDVGARRRDVDVPVGRREHAGRNAGGMIVAGLPGHLVGDQPARRLEVEQLDLGLEQRRAHPLALARHLALEDRKSTRLNSSHRTISYAVFCLKKKTCNVSITYSI